MTAPLSFTPHRLTVLRRLDRDRLYLRLVIRRTNIWRAYRPVDPTVPDVHETLGVADGRAILALVRAGLVEAVDEGTGAVLRDNRAHVDGTVSQVGTTGRLRLTSVGRRTLANWNARVDEDVAP